SSGRVSADLAELLLDPGVGVVGVELVDADERGRRVVVLVERTGTGDRLVRDLLTALEQLDALAEARALRAALGARDGRQVLLDGRAVDTLATDRREGGQHDGVVRL